MAAAIVAPVANPFAMENKPITRLNTLTNINATTVILVLLFKAKTSSSDRCMFG